MSSSKGKLIVIDGGEGSGKGTLISRLKERFPDAVFTREPGGTSFAEIIRDLVVDGKIYPGIPESLNPLTQLLAVMSARADHVEKVIKPALDQGRVVFTDRFDSASWAYQVSKMPELEFLFWETRKNVLGKTDSIQPYYIYLDVNPEAGLARRAGDTTQEMNHFDKKPLSDHEKIREAYLKFMKPDIGRIIDATQPLETVMKEAIIAISQVLSY